ncbi:efflux RND transporter periplasmic adaptor subunit [Oryzomicrobium sp.]|uniref:efflux RND transporter periplasmic adaptor subunit n=1 Tax=Oryzomicrobium sp. TaxID=1911578 RepID=UPI0025EC4166|nr:efflux RND transporter periplasmic adaptor subunit [Oryzomicrobium sp.]MCE1243852.1 efflux RND transporter periplasmic adaptor subunit [Oryzomicrobium sp.]
MSDDKLDLSRLTIDRGALAARPRRRRWPWVAGAVAVAAVLAVGLAGQRAVPVETLSVTTAYPYQAVTVLNAAGYVVAGRKAAVASKATGRLEWLGVREGSPVKEGQVVARLENSDVRAQADQAGANVVSARAELADAEVSFHRTEELAAKKFISPSAVDTARARLNKARAALAQAQAAKRAADVAVDQTLIRAPFDGVVLTKAANVGDVITPFSSATDSKGAVVTMADMASLEVEADVSEANLAKIQVGQPCEIQLDAFPDERLRGRVSRLVPTVDRAKATVLAKVQFVTPDGKPDPRLLPEMAAKVAFLSREMKDDKRQPFTAVHHDAVRGEGDAAVVFEVRDGQARERPVRLGGRYGDLVAVSARGGDALAPGTRLVARPAADLKDGARVKVEAK